MKKETNYKLLFLGYNKSKTTLINFLKKEKILVTHLSRQITLKDLKDIDLVISFGYKKILNKALLKKLKRPAINLHISYLPYNRGAHPNFWSFIDNTPKGVSIHEIDSGIDTGKIIFRQKIKINPYKKTFQLLKNSRLFDKSSRKTFY